jgi:DnaK suppressor protein
VDPQEVPALLALDRESTVALITSMSADLAAVAAASAGGNVDDEHDPEGSTIAFEREQLAGLRSQARAHLRDVDAALDRLDDGRYGRCENCHDAIGDERLAALPATRLCIACAVRPTR